MFPYRRRMVRGVSQRSGWASSGLIALSGHIKAMCFMRWEQGWILVGEIRYVVKSVVKVVVKDIVKDVVKTAEKT